MLLSEWESTNEKFNNKARELLQKTAQEKSDLHRELEKYFLVSPDRKLVLSIDRLDYSKGIPNRLRAFEISWSVILNLEIRLRW